MKKRNIFFLVLIVLLITVGYYGYRTFTIHYEKIGEISFYKDENVELKVVLVHANIPLSYIGNTYSVACQSQNTKAPSLNDEGEWKFDLIEKGWDRIPQAYLGNGIGDNKNLLLMSLADEAKKLYLVKDRMTLVVLASPNVYVSFDGCRHFSNWSLKDNVSADLIVQSTPEFEKCVEQQRKDKEMGLTSYGDCSEQKLSGKNQPVFQDIIANVNGYASFKITSPAFKDNRIIGVETSDSGKTWKFIPNVSVVTNKTNCEALGGRWGKFGLATAEYCDMPPWDQ